MSLFGSKKCLKCGSEITQSAPISSQLGLIIGQRFAKGEASISELEKFYQSLGAKCPSCGKLICSFCYDNSGRQCPYCSSKITYFH